MNITEAMLIVGFLVPLIFAGGIAVTKGRPERFMTWLATQIENLLTKPQIEEPHLPEVFTKWTPERQRAELLDNQDWDERFRKLNKGKAWDYKPSPAPVLRRITDPDGSIVEIRSWQDMIDEEVICNPCARGHHSQCVVMDDELEDICFCDCTEDE